MYISKLFLIIGLILILSAEYSFAQLNQDSIPKNNNVLAVSRTSLNSSTSNVGDIFSAKMVESLTIGGNEIIPSGSIVSGSVSSVKRPTRLSINGKIVISINRIETPTGQMINLQGREIRGIVLYPNTPSIRKRLALRLPVNAASYGTSIPLDKATDLNGGVIYAISQGAAIVGGAITGFIVPNKDQTRFQGSMMGAYNSSPIGSVGQVIGKGKDASINTGDPVILNFDRITVAKIDSQRVATTGQQTPQLSVR